MSQTEKTAVSKEAVRRHLQQARLAYQVLLAEIPAAAWEKPSGNPTWNVRQLMYHK